jgi:hypothetical protein
MGEMEESISSVGNGDRRRATPFMVIGQRFAGHRVGLCLAMVLPWRR